jgi:Syntaxin 6, N-terminal
MYTHRILILTIISTIQPTREVEGSLNNATALFDSWKRIYNTVSSPSNEELLWTADELSSALEAISQDLDDLQESIAAVQAHPEAFNLSGSEVQSRNNFITRTRNTIREMEDTIKNPPRKVSPRNNQVGDFTKWKLEYPYSILKLLQRVRHLGIFLENTTQALLQMKINDILTTQVDNKR